MTYNKTLFSSFKALSIRLMVNLSNFYRVKITHFSRVYMLPNMVLHNVLYMPSFQFNLLSVYELNRQLNNYILLTSVSYFML